MQLKRVYRQYDRGYSFTKEELYEKLEGPFWVAFDDYPPHTRDFSRE